MAVFDLTHRTISLKIVYYGCAMGGKTTNLLTLHRLTDPDSKQGLVSIATKNDRTLFFDLLPLALGQVGGLTVGLKVYTVPGQVHYETTRRQVLAGADGVALVIDSSPDLHQSNSWSLENLLQNLRRNKIDVDGFPIVLQWNKRDLPGALPVQQLAAAFNKNGLPAHEAVATTGIGVIETFAAVVKGALAAAYEKSGRKGVERAQLDELVDKAFEEVAPPSPAPSEVDGAMFEHRFDSDAYREEWADQGRDKQIVDQETLLSEAVQTSMELAEKLDGVRDVEETGERRLRMIAGLERITADLAVAGEHPVPERFMASLLEDTLRTHGSLLLFRRDAQTMEEREVVPGGTDPLNLAGGSIGSAAFRLSQGDEPRLVEDLRSEVFFDDVPPGADALVECLLVPVRCDGIRFGALLIYGLLDERHFGAGERAFWTAAGRTLGLSLHWRALRKRAAAKV